MQQFRCIPVIAVLIFVFACAFVPAQTSEPTICIAPNRGETPERCAAGLCDGGELSVQFDHRPRMQWPKDKSLAVTDLEPDVAHRVVVFRAGKPQQSFTFRFSEFKSDHLCLFLNDLYWTAQLWESKRAPWCKCK
ncbi:MAG TPA: hypothetical protein VGL89_08790 [Candidatus Koribacter sp.]